MQLQVVGLAVCKPLLAISGCVSAHIHGSASHEGQGLVRVAYPHVPREVGCDVGRVGAVSTLVRLLARVGPPVAHEAGLVVSTVEYPPAQGTH